jgi:hypothetical protein
MPSRAWRSGEVAESPRAATARRAVTASHGWRVLFFKQREHSAPDPSGQRVEADIADGALAITVSLLDGVAQGAIFGRLAEHDAVVVLLLKGLVAPIASAS